MDLLVPFLALVCFLEFAALVAQLSVNERFDLCEKCGMQLYYETTVDVYVCMYCDEFYHESTSTYLKDEHFRSKRERINQRIRENIRKGARRSLRSVSPGSKISGALREDLGNFIYTYSSTGPETH